MTVYELNHWLRGHRAASAQRLEVAAFQAWSAAALARQEKMPPLAKWLQGLRAEESGNRRDGVTEAMQRARVQGVMRGLPPPKKRKFG